MPGRNDRDAAKKLQKHVLKNSRLEGEIESNGNLAACRDQDSCNIGINPCFITTANVKR